MIGTTCGVIRHKHVEIISDWEEAHNEHSIVPIYRIWCFILKVSNCIAWYLIRSQCNASRWKHVDVSYLAANGALCITTCSLETLMAQHIGSRTCAVVAEQVPTPQGYWIKQCILQVIWTFSKQSHTNPRRQKRTRRIEHTRHMEHERSKFTVAESTKVQVRDGDELSKLHEKSPTNSDSGMFWSSAPARFKCNAPSSTRYGDFKSSPRIAIKRLLNIPPSLDLWTCKQTTQILQCKKQRRIIVSNRSWIVPCHIS